LNTVQKRAIEMTESLEGPLCCQFFFIAVTKYLRKTTQGRKDFGSWFQKISVHNGREKEKERERERERERLRMAVLPPLSFLSLLFRLGPQTMGWYHPNSGQVFPFS
jgi:hypothetical protein